ncbi:Uncharacterised protein [Burkholderia cepacia]|uniref:Uncharacterized protein n=1 Tax=Burkholderia cepacia TaxID=292 RepID=A0AAE8NM57_BURCE|nr:hypothetical protein CSX04_04963 [Burkholderia cepacia]SQA61458.1 Uncharacterised protein [Burkholderia cepacia]
MARPAGAATRCGARAARARAAPAVAWTASMRMVDRWRRRRACPHSSGCGQAAGGGRPRTARSGRAAGATGCGSADSGRPVADDRWRTTGGGRPVADDRWRKAGGGRPVADGRLRAAGCGRSAAARGRHGSRRSLRRTKHATSSASAMQNGHPGGWPCGAANRGRTRYSAMSADAFAGRAGTVPVACDGVAMSIFGGGASCSTSLV